MKKTTLSLAAFAVFGTSLMAGGDIQPAAVEPAVVEPVSVEVAQAPSTGFYIGGGYAYQHSDVEDHSYNTPVDVDSNNIMLLAGYYYNQYIGVEARYSISVGDVTVEDNTAKEESSDFETTNLAIYLKPKYSINDKFGVYGLLGYGKTTFENLRDEGDDTGFQWGLGANYNVNSKVAVFVDYVNLVDGGDLDGINASPGVDADLDVDTYAVNIGVTYKF